jgi:putative phosphoesterase
VQNQDRKIHALLGRSLCWGKMKIGVFSDLHSNVYALNKMLSIESNVDKWICLGDFVGLFPPVNEVVDILRLPEFVVIKGNHEKFLLSEKKMEYSFTGNDSLQKQRKQISQKNRDYISGLSDTLSITINGIKICLLHSLLTDNEQSSNKYFIDLHDVNDKFSDFDIVMYGDTHLPLISYCKDVVVVNPGSCGFPIDITGLPSYVIFETSDLACKLKRFKYNKEQLLIDISTYGYNHKLFDYLKNGFWRV